MTSRKPGPERTSTEARVLAATGQQTLGDAYYWIATGGGLAKGTDLNQLLRDLLAIDDDHEDARKAVLSLLRSVLASGVDSAAVIFCASQIVPPADYRVALDALAHRCAGGSIRTITAEVALDAQRSNPFTILALCAVAGLSYSDLRGRAKVIPNSPDGDWSPRAMRAAFDVIDRVVRGHDTTDLPNAMPARPLELIPALGKMKHEGWDAVDSALTGGVPYEVLLAQRTVGGAWLAHRNSTSNMLSRWVADSVAGELEHNGLVFRRSTSIGGSTPPAVIKNLSQSDGQTGIVVLGHRGTATYAITFATARDSGTARTSAARLRAMKRDASLPMALVLTGNGWSERNEIEPLARSFEGRVFSERGITALINDVKTVLAEEGHEGRAPSTGRRHEQAD